MFPAAIFAATTVTATRRDDRIVAVHSQRLGDAVIHLDDLGDARGFARYAAGALGELFAIGLEPCGANLEILGDLPIGSGLSSSAALCVALVLAFSALHDTTLPRCDVARIAQRAESRGAGVECGIMDPFAIVFGEAGHALLLDTQTLSYEAIPIPETARVILCDCAVRRRLESAPYRQRQAECAQALAILQRRFAGIASLRDVTTDMLDAAAADLPDDLLRRVQHVVAENRRVLAFAAAVRNGVLEKAGRLMFRSHESLRDDFAVSTPELNELVDIARTCPGVYGARMTGAGFGGCTVNLVDVRHAADFEDRIGNEYFDRSGLNVAIYDGTPGPGASYEWAAR